MKYEILNNAEANNLFKNAIKNYGSVADEILFEANIDQSEESYSKLKQQIVSIQNAYKLFNVDFRAAKYSISSLLSKKDFTRFKEFVIRVKRDANRYKKTIDKAIAEGLKTREKEKPDYPAIFKDSQTFIVKIPQIKTAKAKQNTLLTEINSSLKNKIELKENQNDFTIIHNNKEEKSFSFFNSRHKLLEKAITNSSQIDFEDKELFDMFSKSNFEDIKNLFMNRGKQGNKNNVGLRPILTDEVLYSHLSQEIKNYQNRSFDQAFLTSLKDLSPKYQDIANAMQYSASRNATDQEQTADTVIFSINPYNIATMSTYKDWTSCMSTEGENWDYVPKDIGHGTIVAYAVNKEDPQKRISRIVLKPYHNDKGDLLYAAGKQYGAQIEEFTHIVNQINDEVFDRNMDIGIYKLNDNLYADGLPKTIAVFDTLEQLLDMSGHNYEKIDDNIAMNKLYLSDKCIKKLPDLSNIIVNERMDVSGNLLKSLSTPKYCADLRCNRNKITSLKIPEGCKHVQCQLNELSSLTLPEGIESVYCAGNNLTSLKVPDSCITLDCSINQISSITIPQNCEDIDVQRNNLATLNIPDSIKRLNCENNKLTHLKVGKNCARVFCSDNELKTLNLGENTEMVNCQDNHLTSLILPPKCGEVNCSNNQIGSLEVPDDATFITCVANTMTSLTFKGSCHTINCSRNNLTSLDVPEGCVILECERNNITSLKTPKGCKTVECKDNKLTSIEVGKGCEKLDCSYNQLTSLIVPEGCKEVICNDNQITSLDITKGCTRVLCDNNPLDINNVFIHPDVPNYSIHGLTEEQVETVKQNWVNRDKKQNSSPLTQALLQNAGSANG